MEAFCREHDIGLVTVGPEVPLVEGLADSLAAANLRSDSALPPVSTTTSSPLWQMETSSNLSPDVYHMAAI